MNLYIAQVFESKKESESKVIYEPLKQSSVLVYEKDNSYIDVKTKEAYKTFENGNNGDLVVFPNELVLLQDFLKHNNIEFEKLNKRKSNKVFGGKGKYKNLFICTLKISEMLESDSYGVVVHSLPFGQNAIVYPKKNGNYYNVFSNKKYVTFNSITGIKQVYIGEKTDFYENIDKKFVFKKN